MVLRAHVPHKKTMCLVNAIHRKVHRRTADVGKCRFILYPAMRKIKGMIECLLSLEL